MGKCWQGTEKVSEGLEICLHVEMYYPNVIGINVLAKPGLR